LKKLIKINRPVWWKCLLEHNGNFNFLRLLVFFLQLPVVLLIYFTHPWACWELQLQSKLQGSKSKVTKDENFFSDLWWNISGFRRVKQLKFEIWMWKNHLKQIQKLWVWFLLYLYYFLLILFLSDKSVVLAFLVSYN